MKSKMNLTKWFCVNKLLGLVVIFLVITITSCARKISFLSSPVVPAARGYVKVTKDNNKNFHIQVSLTNLAEVSRLQPPRNSYVVWMETDDQVTKNIGQIKSSSTMFSSKLKASFETVSASKPAKIFITAEDDEDRQYPGNEVVLSTDRF